MSDTFTYDVFFSHSSKDKPVVRNIAERLNEDGVKVWPVPPKHRRVGEFDERVLKPGDSIPARIDLPPLKSYGRTRAGLALYQFVIRHSSFGFEQLCMSANAFGSVWAQLESGTGGWRNLRFRDPQNQDRRFLPLRPDTAPIKGSLAQFRYINRRTQQREQACAKLTKPTVNQHSSWFS